jgi:hypothetical protein
MNGVFCTIKPLAAGFPETESVFSCTSVDKISLIKPAANAFTYHIIDHEGKEGFLVLTLKRWRVLTTKSQRGLTPIKIGVRSVPL